MDSRLEDGPPRMTGIAPAPEEDARALALGERLKAWFAALSGRPGSERLGRHLDSLEHGGPVNGSAVSEPEA